MVMSCVIKLTAQAILHCSRLLVRDTFKVKAVDVRYRQGGCPVRSLPDAMKDSMHEIDTEHFLADLDALRRIGEFRTGVHRPTYSPQDMESRRWLMARMEEAGL